MPEEKPEEIIPEIEIEIKPEGDSTPSNVSDDLPPPPADDDLPPVPDDDELPPVPIDDDLPSVPDGDDLPPIPDDDTPPETLDEPSSGDEPVIDIVLDDDGGGGSTGTEPLVLPPILEDDGGESDAGGAKISAAPVATKLVLTSESGQKLSMNVSTDLGKNNCKVLGEEARYLDTKQMTLEKTGDGWQVVPNANTSNETILNDRAITEPESLKTGDVLAVGRESKGVVKMKMTVQVD